MPELPEVETTIRGLQRHAVGKTITCFWTDWPKYFQRTHKSAEKFRISLLKRTIKFISRRGKNILIHLSDNHALLIHQKLSGHLMIGRWSTCPARKKELGEKWQNQKWVPESSENPNLLDPKNRFIRFIVSFNNNDMLAFSDLRRFGKIMLGETKSILNHPDLARLGPEPTDPDLTPEKFVAILKTKSAAPIKQLLLNQNIISGIGNIYADESLWTAKLHPETKTGNISDADLRKLFRSARQILTQAIALGGTSIDDFRDVTGKKGGYQTCLKVYQREKKPCFRCKTLITRIKIGPRSARFCPKCQEK